MLFLSRFFAFVLVLFKTSSRLGERKVYTVFIRLSLQMPIFSNIQRKTASGSKFSDFQLFSRLIILPNLFHDLTIPGTKWFSQRIQLEQEKTVDRGSNRMGGKEKALLSRKSKTHLWSTVSTFRESQLCMCYMCSDHIFTALKIQLLLNAIICTALLCVCNKTTRKLYQFYFKKSKVNY